MTDRYTLPGSGTPQTVFPFSITPDPTTVEVFRNGILLYPITDYVVFGPNTTIYVTAHNDLIQISYTPTIGGGGPIVPGTASAYIYQALRKCGQLRPGYVPGPEMLIDGLVELQSIFDSLNAERTSQYTMPDFIFPITGPGHGSTGNGQTFSGSGYQIGPTALDFVTPFRPVSIPRMNLYYSTGGTPARLPMAQISMEEWTRITVINLPAINVATVFAYDPQFPNGVIWVWPPLNGNSLEIFTWGFLTAPATLGTTLTFPPGYQEALVWALAERMWPLCILDIMPHKLPFQYICGRKAASIANVRRINAPSPRLINDFRCGSHHASGGSDWGLLFAGI